MLTEPLEDPEAASVESQVARYGEALDAALAGTDRAMLRDRGLDESAIDAIEAGDHGEITVEEAATVLAAGEQAPPADVLQAEVQDELLVGMANAVLDVDALAAELDGDLTPREIQQRVEGRAPMRLDTYAALRRIIATN
jgi:hypothetical protein